MEKYGARVYFYPDGVVQIVQTIKKDGRYVVDTTPSGDNRERHVNPGDNAELGSVLRLAGEGKL